MRVELREIMAGMPFTFPVDVWSLGCVMIAILSGTPPFDVRMSQHTLSYVYSRHWKVNAMLNMFSNTSEEYKFCGNLSPELRTLARSMLQVVRHSGRMCMLLLTMFFSNPKTDCRLLTSSPTNSLRPT
jgi:serine/threonine protein kinase